MVINESKISNIMGDLESSSGVKLSTHRRKLKQRFDIVKKLGQGTYGKVQLAINKETGQEVAIKTIKKCMIETEADLVRIRREIQIMSSVQHPNIIHIYEVFENREKIVFVMEYASGGELYDYLSERRVLEEDESRRIFRQIATAVYYCHKHKICHRDLKLENILLDSNGNAKIADFGLSNVFNGGRLLLTFCGSPLYASPEIVNGTPYLGPEVDCWSLGVLLYTLVYGAMPFDGSHFKRLVKQISNAYFFEPSTPSSASELIHEMLTVSPEKRANIEQICSHWWINETYNESCLQIAEKFANQTPVRLDLLLSLVPPPNVSSENIVITDELDSSSCQPNNNSVSVVKSESDWNIPMTSIDFNNSCPKRKLEVTVSTENANESNEPLKRKDVQLSVMKNDSMISFQPSTTFVVKNDNEHFINNDDDESLLSKLPVVSTSNEKKDDGSKIPTKKKIIKRKSLTVDSNKTSSIPIVNNKPPISERRSSKIFETAEKFQNLLLENQQNKNTVQPFRKISIPGIVNVGGYKKEFERKASLGTTPSSLPTIKPTVQRKSLISPLLDKFSQEKPITCENDNETRRKKAIHIISNAIEGNRKVMVKPKPVLSYTTRSYSLNSNNDTKKIEYPIEKTQSEDVNDAYRTPISFTTKSNQDSDSLRIKGSNSNHTLQNSDSNCPSTTSRSSINESIDSQSKEHIIPIEFEKKIPVNIQDKNSFRSRLPQQAKPPVPNTLKRNVQPQKSTLSRQSTQDSSDADVKTASGEPIRRSPREYIIPISVEGGGFITPKENSVDKTNSQHVMNDFRQSSIPKFGIQRRMSSVSSDHDLSEDDLLSTVRNRRPKSLTRDSDNDDLESNLFNLHRLRSTKPFHKNRFDSDKDVLSSGDEEDEDENFDILTAENLFSTLLQRVRNLTQQMNSNHNFDEKFFNNSEDDWPFSSNILRKPGATSYASSTLPRDKKQLNSSTSSSSSSPNKLKNNKKIEFLQELQSKLTDEELMTLLTPGLSRRLQKQLLKQFLSKDPKFKKLQGEKDQNEISNEIKKIANDITELTTKTINTDTTLTSDSTTKSINRSNDFSDNIACSSHNQKIDKSSNNTNQKETKNDVNNDRPKSMILLNEKNKIEKNLKCDNVEQQTSKLPIFRKKSIQDSDKKSDLKVHSEVAKRRSLPLLDDPLMSSHRASICSNATCDDDITTATTASFDSWSGCSSDLHSPMPYANADRTSSTTSRSMTPRLFDETESISDRIRRKSFYTRFNEWRSPRKSSSPSSSSLINYNMYSTLPRRSFDSSLSSMTSSSSRPSLFANRKCERSHSVNARSLTNSKPSSIKVSKYQIAPISSHRPASFLLPTYSTSYSR